ncbi:MAG: YceI family protein [Chitinophagaceae bacterium]|nr:YceI family protein [Chitinophagaceae bacterium]
MKKLLIPFAAVALLATACQQAPDAAKAETAEKQDAAVGNGATYTVDATASRIAWIGTKPIAAHNGDFKLSGGTFTVDNGNVTSGSFVIDISSIQDFDLEGKDNEKLIGHLKGPDFFDVGKYPTAKFEITSVEALQNDTTGTHKVSGNLTLKDSTKNVTFPATVTVTDTELKATANFNIDRNEWGIHFNNKQSLGDNFIRPEVNLTLNIAAKK